MYVYGSWSVNEVMGVGLGTTTSRRLCKNEQMQRNFNNNTKLNETKLWDFFFNVSFLVDPINLFIRLAME